MSSKNRKPTTQTTPESTPDAPQTTPDEQTPVTPAESQTTSDVAPVVENTPVYTTGSPLVVNNVLHTVLKLAKTGDTFMAECGRIYTLADARPGEPIDLGKMCDYCADGEFAPVDVPAPVIIIQRAPRATKPQLPWYVSAAIARDNAARDATDRLIRLNAALATLRTNLNTVILPTSPWLTTPFSSDQPGYATNVSLLDIATPATTILEVLGNALVTIKAVSGTKRAYTRSASTGDRAERGTYAPPENTDDTPELGEIRRYATAGEERAISIINHVDAWVDTDGKPVKTQDKLVDNLCSFCKSDKHIRRTGFFSASREIEKMRERAANVPASNVTSMPETSSDSTVEAAA